MTAKAQDEQRSIHSPQPWILAGLLLVCLAILVPGSTMATSVTLHYENVEMVPVGISSLFYGAWIDFDLGQAVAHVDSAYLHVRGMMACGERSCTSEYGDHQWTRACDFDFLAFVDGINSASTDMIFMHDSTCAEQCDSEFEFTRSFRLADYVGYEWDLQYEYFPIPQSRWDFLRDGTGRLTINYDCLQVYDYGACSPCRAWPADVYELDLTFVFEPAVPTSTMSWGAIKTLYR
jgi:hypothetical protein